MFEKWNIPDDICDNYPIGLNSLDLFVGHSEQTKFLSGILTNKSVVLLEGEIGVGKTSLGNYIRHSKKGFFSPLLEIPCKPKWDNDTFMGIVLAAIVKEIMRSGTPHKKLRKHETIREINEKFSDLKLANLGITGAGFGISKGSGFSRTSFINQTILIDYLLKVGEIIGEQYRQPAPIIMQVNNLDTRYSFSEDDLTRLFNDIRDTLQIPNISWIICGDSGLGNFLKKNVPRVGQIINTIVTVEPLSFEEIITAFRLRIKKAGMKGEFPVEPGLLKYIYDISNGSFREILNIIYQLLVRYYNEPLVTTITGEHARFFFYEAGRRHVETLKKSKIQYPVFEAVVNHPGINQKNLSKLVGKQQSNVSRVTKELEAMGFIIVKKEGRVNYYYPDIKYRIGFSNINGNKMNDPVV